MGATSVVNAAAGVVTHDSEAATPALEVTGLGFNYGDRTALEGVTFSIARGEIFGFLGPNGGGKTTLFKLISTLVPLKAGSARVLGYDLRGETMLLRHRLGVVFQHPSVDGKLTVAENLAYHGRLYGIMGSDLKQRAARMLERLGLVDRAGDLVETLSGGLKRRVELAKAMLHQPDLLILDEPSTGLDPAARREFLGNLTRMREHDGVTIILTTHHMEEAERCDRIGILHQGRLVAIAPPGELKSRVGGDVVVVAGAPEPDALARRLLAEMRVKSTVIDGTLRIERPRGHELVRELVDRYGDEIESVTFGKPTLEDVFVHLTGQRFDAGGRTEQAA